MEKTIKKVNTILTKKQQTEFLENNWSCKTLHFKWGKTGSHKCWLYDRADNVLARQVVEDTTSKERHLVSF